MVVFFGSLAFALVRFFASAWRRRDCQRAVRRILRSSDLWHTPDAFRPIAIIDGGVLGTGERPALVTVGVCMLRIFGYITYYLLLLLSRFLILFLTFGLLK